jgi:hypothetical protein
VSPSYLILPELLLDGSLDGEDVVVVELLHLLHPLLVQLLHAPTEQVHDIQGKVDVIAVELFHLFYAPAEHVHDIQGNMDVTVIKLKMLNKLAFGNSLSP